MLSYKNDNNTCYNKLLSRGININDKTTLKAVASMAGANFVTNDSVQNANACVVPSESLWAFNTNSHCIFDAKNYENDFVQATYRLPTTKKGKLSKVQSKLENQKQNGVNMYPLNGCYKNIDNSASKFMTSAGSILDFKNQKTLYELRVILKRLQDECAALDMQIAEKTLNLEDTRKRLAEQQATCSSYRDNVNYLRGQTYSMQQELNGIRSQKDSEYALYLQSDKMVDYLNRRLINARSRPPPVVQTSSYVPNSGSSLDPQSAPIQSQNTNDIVRVYEHCDYRGWNIPLKYGSYTWQQLASMIPGKKFDNNLSSVKFEPNQSGRITLYEHDQYTGRSIDITNNVSCLTKVGRNFNDITTSIIVSPQ